MAYEMTGACTKHGDSDCVQYDNTKILRGERDNLLEVSADGDNIRLISLLKKQGAD